MNFLRTCLEVSNCFVVEASRPISFSYRSENAVVIHILNDMGLFGRYCYSWSYLILPLPNLFDMILAFQALEALSSTSIPGSFSL